MVNKVYSNRLSQYTNENGGKIFLLFLLFLLSIYTLITSGIQGLALVAVSPAIIIFIYLTFKYRMFVFWILFIVNYYVMFISKEQLLVGPASMYNELLEIILIAVAIIDLRESNFQNLANLMTIGILGWCGFCLLEIINDTCGLGINITSWFTGVRLMAFLLLYIVVVFALYITTPKRTLQVLFAWAICALFSVFWCWKQQKYGWTHGESTWLFTYDHARQHIVNGITRYFSTFTDAANFGIHMAAASVAFFVISITNNIKILKIFFFIAGLLCTWAMFQSGTRTAIFCLIAGFVVFLILSKSMKIFIPISILLAFFVSILMFTKIGDGNNQIRRMRSAFAGNKDASANVRVINKAAISKYMKDAPWGIGIGMNTDQIPARNKFKKLSTIPPDSEYVFIWIRTGWIGVSWFTFINIMVLLGACWLVLFKIENKSLRGIGAAWCCAFVALHLGGYANQILLQYPNALIFYGGLTTVYLYPKIDVGYKEYENNVLLKKQEIIINKLAQKFAKRV